jgi:hypothetical protein
MGTNREQGLFNAKEYFDMLTEWKELPDYQMERRVDSLIGYYLQPFLVYRKIEIKSIIPEFPLKKEGDQPSIPESSEKRKNNQPTRVDFFAYSEGQCYLIELKTDIKSINQKQIDNLSKASNKPIKDILEELLEIYNPADRHYPDSWKKYVQLLDKLIKETSLIKNVEEENKNECERPKYKVNKKNKMIDHKPEVIYIIPTRENTDLINQIEKFADIIVFQDIIDWLRKKNDKDSFDYQFANALAEWAKRT